MMKHALASLKTLHPPLRRTLTRSRQLLSEAGEMNGSRMARELAQALGDLDAPQLDAYFAFLAQDLSPDPQQVLATAQAYAERRDAQSQIALLRAAEPPRQELLRRLNRTPGGTEAILRLRRALLARLPQHPELRAIEADLLHLLSSWFNPGFLQMRRVDWNAPAQLLEKIIQHEAVHAIDGWEDLRRRLQPDRRCFAFFHPQLPQEPLIFVEVALTDRIPHAIAPLIDKSTEPLAPAKFRVAAFYSISNCEPGLRGVSLGNFLIKQVAEQLHREFPQLKTFCTLSPIPGFCAWLRRQPTAASQGVPSGRKAQAFETALRTVEAAHSEPLSTFTGLLPPDDSALAEALQTLCAVYLRYGSTHATGDPVARFHLDNGARLERLNARGDASPKGIRQSCGWMVNYLYDLDRIETNNLRFRQGDVARSRVIDGLI